MMDRIHIERGSSNTPLISVVVVDSRSKTNPQWVEVCLESVRKQWFKDWELIVVDNTDFSWSIGKAFEEASKVASTKWILFLGDDDYIQWDYLMSCYYFAEKADKDLFNCVGITTYGFLFNEEEQKMGLLKKVPFGMMKRDKVLEIGFNKELTKHIDVDFLQRTGVQEGKANVAIMFWNYGYFYRSHDKQVSGKKGY